MGFSNFKIRHKVLAAVTPLVAIVLIATLFSSIEIKRIDARYRGLIDHDETAVMNLTKADACLYRLEMLLYQADSGHDAGGMRHIDAGMEKTYSEYKSLIADSIHEIPARAGDIAAAAALLNKVFMDSRALGANAPGNAGRVGLIPRIESARRALSVVAGGLRRDAVAASEDISRQTRRTILVTWLVIGFNLVMVFVITGFIARREVVDILSSLRGSIQDLAEGRLDRPIPYLDRTNEAGEAARALHILQRVVQEHDMQSWVKAEVSAILERLQPAEDFATFAAVLLSHLAESVPLLYGAFYVADESRKRFVRVGGFALDTAGEKRGFVVGEGLVGQAAFERRPVTISASAADSVYISTAIGVVTPRILLAVPVINRDSVLAVIELAPVEPLSERQQALLSALLPMAALNVDSLAQHIATKILLEEAQAKASALAVSEHQIVERQEELKAINAAMSAERKRLKHILDMSPIGVGILVEDIVQFANKQFLEMIDLKIGDSTFGAYVDPEERSRLLAQLGEQGEVRDFELQMYGQGGDIRDVCVTYMQIEYEGRPGVLAWLLDLTERKRTEAAVKESQRHLSAILDNLPDFTFVIDRRGVVTAWNRAAEELSGVKAEDMLGKGDYEYAIPFYGEARPCLIDQALSQDFDSNGAYRHLHRLGDAIVGEGYSPRLGIWFEARATVLRDVNGQV
ncbi:MAG: PAS domain S-box protein, partial [Desulfobacteraceae bacterium]|nr:PAS domain S-box protein [Desulfobacteraceae bacterium]